MIAQALPSEKVGPFYSVEALSCRDDRDGGTSPGAVHLACPEGEPVFLLRLISIFFPFRAFSVFRSFLFGSGFSPRAPQAARLGASTFTQLLMRFGIPRFDFQHSIEKDTSVIGLAQR
jgi:hypothetical protein